MLTYTLALAQTALEPAADGRPDAQSRAHAVAQTVQGILSYVRWPVEMTEMRLCIVGPTEYADELTHVEQLPLSGGRRIIARRYSIDEVPADCDVVYVGVLSSADWRLLLRRIALRPVVTIGERREQCLAGGMFCLDVRDADLSFEVNLDSVARSGVRVHPNVLQLGRRKGGHTP
ncbi:MAG TPA: YfiR family protein [Burkholderiaceae bacterium]